MIAGVHLIVAHKKREGTFTRALTVDWCFTSRLLGRHDIGWEGFRNIVAEQPCCSLLQDLCAWVRPYVVLTSPNKSAEGAQQTKVEATFCSFLNLGVRRLFCGSLSSNKKHSRACNDCTWGIRWTLEVTWLQVVREGWGKQWKMIWPHLFPSPCGLHYSSMLHFCDFHLKPIWTWL